MVSPLLCDLREAAVPLWSICFWKGSSGRCSPCCLTRKSCVSVSHAVNNEGTVLTKLYSRPNTPQKPGEVHGVRIRWFQSGYHSAWPLSVKKGPERGGGLQASISGMGAPGPCCPTGHREVGGDLSCLDRKGW